MTVRWLSTAEAARRLGLRPWEVRDLIQSGVLAAVKTGPGRTCRWRVTERAVDNLARRPS